MTLTHSDAASKKCDMTDLDSATRDFFDGIFEEVLASAPPSVRDLIETLPVVVEDHPDESIQQEFGINANDLCGLHSGVPLTERSVEDSGVLPDVVYLYRLGIISAANDKLTEEEKNSPRFIEAVREEIRITLLHELGHHFGLSESDLDRLGYG